MRRWTPGTWAGSRAYECRSAHVRRRIAQKVLETRSDGASLEAKGQLVPPVEQQDHQSGNRPRKTKPNEQLPLSCTKLPLSPLMDPKLIAARERYRTPKPAPSGELSPFSKKLQNNPYAQALATPVRQCRFTGLRLPEYFHLSFGLQQHSTTCKIWYLPKLALDAEPDLPQGEICDQGGVGAAEASVGLDELDHCTALIATDEKKRSRTVSGTHFVAQKGALRFLSRMDKKKDAQRLPYRWKTSSSLDLRDIVWREDMDDYVLELLRRNLLKQLKYVAARPSGYITKCSTYEEVKKHTQLGAALWLGDDENNLVRFEDNMTESNTNIPGESDSPPAYAMLDYRGHYIPLYNLQTLLGKVCLEQLRESNVRFQDKIAVLKQKRNTVPVQLALWKLLGYHIPNE